ncbi:hypothetical protein DEO29_02465 [Buchnera aphidicola (Schizaphis graminum)]|nr:hypothetical protein DEO29_02465 [Buchnera aphidicola (Schizaphis graminum)]
MFSSIEIFLKLKYCVYKLNIVQNNIFKKTTNNDLQKYFLLLKIKISYYKFIIFLFFFFLSFQ